MRFSRSRATRYRSIIYRGELPPAAAVFPEIIRRFPGESYLRRGRNCLSRQHVKLKQRARENRRDLETARSPELIRY